MIEQTEEDVLLNQWQQGDQESFSRIVRQYLHGVVNLAFRYLKDRHLAEDVAQEIFLKLYQNPDSWKPTARFSSWLYRVTFNACMDEFRKRKRNPGRVSGEEKIGDSPLRLPASGGGQSPIFSPRDQAISQETVHRIHTAIDSLPEDQKRVILLYQEELSYERIAEILGCSVKGVERRLYRARKRLQKKIREAGG